MADTNAEEFSEYVRAREVRYVRLAYLLCGNQADAEDLVQDVLMACYPKWRRITQNGDPDKYVRGAIVKRSRGLPRRAFRRKEALGSAVPDVADPELDVAEPVFRVMALQKLSHVARVVVVARVEAGLSWQEIGELVNYSPRQAQRIYNDALEELRSHLGGGG
ncbi:hypothetical protein FHP29_18005 [Nocardioides albidus]|uniref:RNA polymerase sigma-70 region 2 domain-containing protein n=1 Tax=Nocardioides albidus TaxID=1517589 RepID=A0A5C4VPD1_9ACTN|nr:sigma factor [Nocardioides albidus]TNM37678.1 hypothetical protein FHP29_18005 [Nocardioides albidus]